VVIVRIMPGDDPMATVEGGAVLDGPTASTWAHAAASVRWDTRPFIDGRYRRSSSASDVFDNVNPATEETLCTVAVGSTEDVDEAVRVARERFRDGCWSGLSPARRAEALLKLADLIVEQREELALLDCLEMGRPIQAALGRVQDQAPSLLRSWAGVAERLLGEAVPVSAGTLAFNTYEPRGVVGAIIPWNSPVSNAVYKLGPALAAGNTIVLKPSELSPSSALRLAELAMEAGVPDGVLNVVPGLGSTVGEALAMHQDVDFLTFTGSTATGRRIMELSGRSNGKPLLLECGGKSPQVVFDDVDDLDRVADATVQGVVTNQGQVCSAHTRLLVQHAIKDALLERIVESAARYEPGDPLDEATTFGPLASREQRNRVKAYIDQGLEAGAEAVLGGRVQDESGCYVWPTIFDRVDSTMSIAQEEIFGPVLCVQGFETEEDAIALANGTKYALAGTVWTRDLGRGRRLAHTIKAAALQIRTSGPEEAGSYSVLSYEPTKASGFGPEIGLRGLESYSALKVVYMSGH
jgi:acyl-CoA reductase-like NAD-dependent aldehyde dehydrogenase